MVVTHLLLRRALQIARGGSALPQHLHGAEHVLRLVVIRVAEVGGPLLIAVELGQDLGKSSQCLYAGIPTLRIGPSGDLFWRGMPLVLEPTIGIGNLGGVGGGSEHLGHQRVWIKRDGSSELLKLFRAQGLRLGRIGLLRVCRLAIPLIGIRRGLLVVDRCLRLLSGIFAVVRISLRGLLIR